VASRSPSLERVADHSALFGLAIAVGLLSGGIAVAFQWALARAAWLREGGARGAPTGDWKLPVAILFSALAVWAGVAVVRRFAPETSGSGIPQVEAALHRDVDVKWPRILWVKFTGGLLAIGGGLTLGREGPTVFMGAALGRALGGPLTASGERGQTLLAAGAGAGLAAAFNAPLAGTLFVLEELKVLRTPRHALAALLACVTSDQVYRSLLGRAPQLGAIVVERPGVSAFLPLLLLGVPHLPVAYPFLHWPPVARVTRALTHPVFCWLSATFAVMVWHVPAVFELGMRSHWWHHVQFTSFFAAGLLFWWPVIQPWQKARWSRWSIPVYLFLATLPCDVLSAYLTFCDDVVYAPYRGASPALNATALQDQQTAGALMWVSITFVYLLPAVVITLQILSPRDYAMSSLLSSSSRAARSRS